MLSGLGVWHPENPRVHVRKFAALKVRPNMATRKLLQRNAPQCNVVGHIALSEIAFKREFPDRPYAFWDVVDARDFLMGSYAGGLVVQLFNRQIARAPYLAPYVSLSSRANIPPDQEHQLSLDILDLNIQFFQTIGDISLRRTSQPFQNLMAAAGFSPDDTMTGICATHRKRLALGERLMNTAPAIINSVVPK